MLIQKIQLLELLKSNKVIYSQQHFYKDLIINIISTTFNYEVIKMDVFYGYFNTILTIINIDSSTLTEKLLLINSGRYGHIYQYEENQNKLIAIKMIKFEENFQEVFYEGVKQYFILLIASIIKAGPTVENLYGFNLVVYRNSIQFGMELCQLNHQLNRKQSKQLTSILLNLHVLDIVHMDIKPQNIAYSSVSASFVFIDFGFSLIKMEKIGEKSLTGFTGSLNYCGKEMASFLYQRKQGLIDLYRNDRICLSKSLLEINKQQALNEQQSQKKQNSFLSYNPYSSKVSQFLQLINAKSLLYHLAQATSCSFEKKIQVNNIHIIIKYITMLIPFIKVLQRNFLLQEFIMTSSMIQVKEFLVSFKLKNREKSTINTLFYDRYKIIQYRNIIADQDQYIQPGFILFDLNKISEMKKQEYFFILMEFIKINGQFIDFESIHKACQIAYYQYFYDQKQQIISFQAMHQQIMNNILKFCLEDPFSLEKYKILKGIMQTLIILEIIPQQKLKQLFTKILIMKISTFKILFLVFQFITALEFINFKYKTCINYEKMKNFWKNTLLSFTLQFTGKNKANKQQNAIEIIKLFLQQEENLKIIEKITECAEKNTLTSEEQYFLQKKLKMYILYSSTLDQLTSQLTIQYQLNQLLQDFQNSQEIIVYHNFLLCQISYYANDDKLFYQVYNRLMKRLGHFTHQNHFNMQCDCLVIFIQKAICFQQKEETRKNIENKLQKVYLQIINIYTQISYNRTNFRRYIDKFCYKIFGQNLKKQNKLKILLNNLMKICPQQLIEFSQKQYSHKKQQHKNVLQEQMQQIYYLMNIMFQNKVLNDRQQKIFQTYVSKCKQMIGNIACFECKVTSIIQLRIICIQYEIQNKHYHNIVGKTVDLLTLCAKDYELMQFQQILMCLLYYSTAQMVRNKVYAGLQQQIYQIQPIIFFIKQQMSIHFKRLHLFKNLPYSHTLFLNVYFYLISQGQQIQLLHFIQQICIQLYVSPSSNARLFYEEMKKIVMSIIHHQQHHEIFIQRQGMVMQVCMDIKSFNPYLSLYLSALRNLQLEKFNYKRLMIKIAGNLPFLPYQPKRLVLSNYYHFYKFYFLCSNRKLKFLNKMDYYFNNNVNKKDYNVFSLKKERKMHFANTVNVKGMRSCLKKLKDNLNNLQ